MKPTTDWIRSTLALPAVFALALSPLQAAPADWETKKGSDLREDNLKNLFSPNDEGKLGAGDKESMFRWDLGKVVLRADLKVVAGLKADGRRQNNDDLQIDESQNGTKKMNDDGTKSWKRPTLDFVAGVAADLDFARTIEAFSIEYKKDLIAAAATPFFGPDTESQTKTKEGQNALQKFLSNEDFTVKIAGFTVRCGGDQNAAGAMGNEADGLGSGALTNGALLKNGIKLQYWAVIVPIIVRGNGGMSLSMGLSPVIDTDHSAYGVELEPGAYLHGWLSAGIGGAIGPFSISAGIAGKLRFLDTTLALEGGVVVHNGGKLYGSMKLVVQPIKFEALLFAQVSGWCFSKQLTWSLFTAKMAKIEKQLGGTPRDELPDDDDGDDDGEEETTPPGGQSNEAERAQQAREKVRS